MPIYRTIENEFVSIVFPLRHCDDCVKLEIGCLKVTLTMIMSKLFVKWSGSVRLETSSSLMPLKRSCFLRSLGAGNGFGTAVGPNKLQSL